MLYPIIINLKIAKVERDSFNQKNIGHLSGPHGILLICLDAHSSHSISSPILNHFYINPTPWVAAMSS